MGARIERDWPKFTQVVQDIKARQIWQLLSSTNVFWRLIDPLRFQEIKILLFQLHLDLLNEILWRCGPRNLHFIIIIFKDFIYFF